ncbi:uncharacterized protein LOC105664153 [Megachile rotundata]|uniref:uncharacterized protein LOC105664153 n=1 Tax=Megachile rotundata TaxID=143995 RepID=UPI003FCF8D20
MLTVCRAVFIDQRTRLSSSRMIPSLSPTLLTNRIIDSNRTLPSIDESVRDAVHRSLDVSDGQVGSKPATAYKERGLMEKREDSVQEAEEKGGGERKEEIRRERKGEG